LPQAQLLDQHEVSAEEGHPETQEKADEEARHETVVMCLDAGNAVGMENVRLTCVDEEDL
jgi:biopolymer transport protein ExbD